jgi:hypothetical protein
MTGMLTVVLPSLQPPRRAGWTTGTRATGAGAGPTGGAGAARSPPTRRRVSLTCTHDESDALGPSHAHDEWPTMLCHHLAPPRCLTRALCMALQSASTLSSPASALSASVSPVPHRSADCACVVQQHHQLANNTMPSVVQSRARARGWWATTRTSEATHVCPVCL